MSGNCPRFEITPPGSPPPPPPELATVSRFRLTLVREAELAEAKPPSIERPEQAVNYLWRHVFNDEPREVAAVLFADSFNRATGHLIAYTGTRSNVPLGMHQILAPALLANAAAIVLAHNHVSGLTRPSPEDLRATRDVWAAGRLLRSRFSTTSSSRHASGGSRCAA